MQKLESDDPKYFSRLNDPKYFSRLKKGTNPPKNYVSGLATYMMEFQMLEWQADSVGHPCMREMSTETLHPC